MFSVAITKTKDLTGWRALVAATAGAVFTALCAKIAFYLPGNPVPVTMQVFAVVLCGLLLGYRVAAVAMIEYIAMGAVGIPVFSGLSAGSASVFGPTGGYIAGFVPAAMVVGLLYDMFATRTYASAVAAGIAGVFCVYIFGTAWLSIWLIACGRESVAWTSWMLGAAPFVFLDAAKVALAAAFVAKK